MVANDETDPVVLIVEDDRELAELYADYLSDSYTVRTAYTREEAGELLDFSVDVVLLDRKLPESSGRQILDQIEDEGYDCRIAMVTGVDPDFTVLDLEVDDYLTKPVSRDELRRTVALLINLNTFDKPIREFHSLAAKRAAIESEMSKSELAESDAYKTKILQDVYDHELPTVLADLMADYQELKTYRPVFMWKWVHKLAPWNTLPIVDERYQEEVPIDKTLTILYVTLLDDVLEKCGDRATFWELSKLPRNRASATTDDPAVDTDYIKFGERVWSLLDDRLRQGPDYEQFIDLYHYDVRQAINAIEYSDLVIQQPNIATMADLRRYESHNMVMFSYADIDLMHTTQNFDGEFATIREAIWHAQQMARIGNWMSTWERELREGDVSSGVVIYALEQDIIEHGELKRLTNGANSSAESVIDRIRAHKLEEYFFERWTHHYEKLESINQRINSFDLTPFIEGTEEVLRFHLASRGLK